MTEFQRVVVPGLTEDEQDTLNELWAKLAGSREHNETRSAYYEMKNVVSRLTDIVPPQYKDAYSALGWVGKAVDTLARRCNFEQAHWQGDLGSLGYTPDDPNPDMPEGRGDLLDLGYGSFSDDNSLRAVVRSAGVGSLVHGVSFLINDPHMRPDEETSTLQWGSAHDTTGLWDERYRRFKAALSINSWRAEGGLPQAFTLYLPDVLIEVEWQPTNARYGILGEWSHDYGVPVEAMVYKPFLRPFGTSRITRAMMGFQDRAISALIRMDAHMDIYAIPDFWLLGANASVFGPNVRAWQVMMGRIKAIPDDEELIDAGSEYLGAARADVKQFPASSPEPHLAAINAIAKLFARESDLPDAALAITDVSNPTSADSYIESREAIIAEAEGATDDWSLPLKRALARGLAIQNDDPALYRELNSNMELQWRSPVFLSRAAAADAGGKQLAAAPPWLKETTVGLELLGLTPQQIRRAQQEREGLPEAPPPPPPVVPNPASPVPPEPNGTGQSEMETA